jgi:proteasome beta subunit
MTRRIFPIVTAITEDGFRRLPDSEVADIARSVLDGRLQHPDGPQAEVL